MHDSESFPYRFERHPQKKGVCSECGHKNSFRYYEGLSREFGKCERINNCGYHNKPNGAVKYTPTYKYNERKGIFVFPDEKECLLILNDRASAFHLYCEKKLGIPEAHLRKWGVGSRNGRVPSIVETAFILRNKDKRAVNIKFFQYDHLCKRIKSSFPYHLSSKNSNETYKNCLYGEHLLSLNSSERPVCLVESEKTAVIASYFYPQYDWLATGGSNGLSKEKTYILKNKIVYYIGDADSTGRKNSTIQRLKDLRIAFHIIDLFPQRTDGYDLADAIIEGLHPPILLPSYSPPGSDPKEDMSHPYESKGDPIAQTKVDSALIFPIDVLPKPIQDYVVQGANTLNYPIDFVGVTALVALSTAIGNSFRIQVKNGWPESPILFAALVGDSGIRKTPSINFALKPIFRRHELMRIEYLKQMKEFRERNSDESSKNETKLIKPVCQQLYSTDATMEAIVKTFNENPRGFLYSKDEMMGWIKEFNRYNKGADEQQWLSIWSGSDISLHRKHAAESLYAKNPFISLIGGLQPDLLEDLFKDKRNVSGLAARLLFSFPAPIRRQFTREEISAELTDKYYHVFDKIFNIHLALDDTGNLQSSILKFDQEAQERFERWCEDDINKPINNPNTSQLEKSILSKLEAYCTRFALILQIANWACDLDELIVIKKHSLEAAIKLIEYFKAHALKVHHYVKASNTNQLVKILNWIEQNGGRATKRDLYRNSVAGISNKSQADDYFQLLVQKGFGKITLQQSQTGGHLYEVFTPHPTHDT